MDYTQAVDFLFTRKQKGMKLGLERMIRFLRALDHPEHKFKSIHIAGTNGKGSTAAMLSSILEKAGHRTGLYTSPHLIDMRERIQINRIPIPEADVISLLSRMQPYTDDTDATFFECLTAMAFLYFSIQKVDIAVIETGLGGRLDATNTLTPVLTLITEIGLDHTRILGKTLERIAAEKAGIMKPDVPCVAGTRFQRVNRLLTETARQIGCPLAFTRNSVRFLKIEAGETGSYAEVHIHDIRYRRLYLSLPGRHQIFNMGTALLAVEHLKRSGWDIPEQAVRNGLANVTWPARMDLVQTQPKILIDSAHNPMGMRRLAHSLQKLYTYRRLIFIFGVLADKEYRSMLRIILPLADHLILTKPVSERALPPEKLEHLPELRGKRVSVVPVIAEALEMARSEAKPEDMIVGAGSIYFVGELLKIVKAE